MQRPSRIRDGNRYTMNMLINEGFCRPIISEITSLLPVWTRSCPKDPFILCLTSLCPEKSIKES